MTLYAKNSSRFIRKWFQPKSFGEIRNLGESYRCNEFKLWKFWECLLHEVLEYAFKVDCNISFAYFKQNDRILKWGNIWKSYHCSDSKPLVQQLFMLYSENQSTILDLNHLKHIFQNLSNEQIFGYERKN